MHSPIVILVCESNILYKERNKREKNRKYREEHKEGQHINTKRGDKDTPHGARVNRISYREPVLEFNGTRMQNSY